MLDNLFTYLIILLVIGLFWVVIKRMLKLTAKVFSCGCAVLVIVAAVVIILGGMDIPFFQ